MLLVHFPVDGHLGFPSFSALQTGRIHFRTAFLGVFMRIFLMNTCCRGIPGSWRIRISNCTRGSCVLPSMLVPFTPPPATRKGGYRFTSLAMLAGVSLFNFADFGGVKC